MLILVAAIILGALAWLVLKGSEEVHPIVRRTAIAAAIVCVGVAMALRAGLVGLLLLAGAGIVVWLRMRGSGGGGPGGGQDEPEPEPDPDPAASRPAVRALR